MRPSIRCSPRAPVERRRGAGVRARTRTPPPRSRGMRSRFAARRELLVAEETPCSSTAGWSSATAGTGRGPTSREASCIENRWAEVLEYTNVADRSRVRRTSLSGWCSLRSPPRRRPAQRLVRDAGLHTPAHRWQGYRGEVVAVGDGRGRSHIGDRCVIDPSLSEVAEGSRLSGRGDLYGDLAVIGPPLTGRYAEYCPRARQSHVHLIPPRVRTTRRPRSRPAG